MPIYEYVCDEDGSVIELMRPASDADKPVADPDGKGRVYKRKFSTFAAQGSPAGKSVSLGGCCPCGKNKGSCSAN